MRWHFTGPTQNIDECLVVNGNTERDSVQYEERRTGSDVPSDAKHGESSSPASLSEINVLKVREVFTKQEIKSLPLRGILAAVL